MKTNLNSVLALSVLSSLATALLVSGCGSSSSSTAGEDSSPSGAAASAAGGALSASGSGGTMAYFPGAASTFRSRLNLALEFAPSAFAAIACPTFKTATGSGCTSGGASLWLSYAGCSFGSSAATWTGTQAITMSSGSANCGTFPTPPASGTLIRQYVSGASSTTPSTVSITSRFGTVTTIDHATANLGNFNSDSITAVANGGYGTTVGFNASGARNSITLAQRMYVSGGYDHSISGNLTVTESAGASSRVLTGSVKVYHNLVRVIGTSTFNNVTHTDGCCYPTSGNISTVFAAGGTVAPRPAGLALVGKTETLTFTGCGTASLAATDGTTSDVALSRCF